MKQEISWIDKLQKSINELKPNFKYSAGARGKGSKPLPKNSNHHSDLPPLEDVIPINNNQYDEKEEDNNTNLKSL